METLPLYVPLIFVLTVLLSVSLFLNAAHYSKNYLILILSWIAFESGLALMGIYNDPATMTSRFPLLVMPPFVFILLLFLTNQGRVFIDSLDIKMLTIFHVIRVPVEFVLLGLYMNGSIPEAMTFEGRNFDILSGLTAPIIYYFGFVKKSLSHTIIILWNAVCILLLINVVSSAVLALPGRFQSFGFEQPNVAVGYFPFVLLPTVLVPMVFFSHFAAIRLLRKKAVS